MHTYERRVCVCLRWHLSLWCEPQNIQHTLNSINSNTAQPQPRRKDREKRKRRKSETLNKQIQQLYQKSNRKKTVKSNLSKSTRETESQQMFSTMFTAIAIQLSRCDFWLKSVSYRFLYSNLNAKWHNNSHHNRHTHADIYEFRERKKERENQ